MSKSLLSIIPAKARPMAAGTSHKRAALPITLAGTTMALLKYEVWIDSQGLSGLCLAGSMGDQHRIISMSFKNLGRFNRVRIIGNNLDVSARE